MTAFTIEHEESRGRGAFFVGREGTRLGEMTYSRTDPQHVIVGHTEVHEQLRGLGIARQLLDATVAWARSTGTRLTVLCPYAKSQFERDPSIRDVLAR